jgi:hypothetical protein
MAKIFLVGLNYRQIRLATDRKEVFRQTPVYVSHQGIVQTPRHTVLPALRPTKLASLRKHDV